MILENSRVYHSESDSGSESLAESSPRKEGESGERGASLMFSDEFLNGCKRDGETEISS